MPDSLAHPLPDPFIVIATQNPIEYEGTYPLPEAQLDRFLFKLAVAYPSAQQEQEVLARHDRGLDPHDAVAAGVRPVATAADMVVPSGVCQTTTPPLIFTTVRHRHTDRKRTIGQPQRRQTRAFCSPLLQDQRCDRFRRLLKREPIPDNVPGGTGSKAAILRAPVLPRNRCRYNGSKPNFCPMFSRRSACCSPAWSSTTASAGAPSP